MAIGIKSIPVLKYKAAAYFPSKVADNNAKRFNIDFSKHSSVARKIFAKAKI